MSCESRRVLSMATLGLLGVGLLSACTPPSPEPTTPSTASGDSSTAPEEEAMPTGPECLIGDWYIAEDQMQNFYSAVSDSITVSGGTGLSFAASTYEYTPDFAIVVEVAGTEGEGSITGAVKGDYSATDSEITTSHDVSNVAVSVTVSGVTMDGTDLFGDFMSTAPINSAPYECAAQGPVLHFDTGPDNPRVPVQLTPAS